MRPKSGTDKNWLLRNKFSPVENLSFEHVEYTTVPPRDGTDNKYLTREDKHEYQAYQAAILQAVRHGIPLEVQPLLKRPEDKHDWEPLFNGAFPDFDLYRYRVSRWLTFFHNINNS